jgi:DNA-binding transcriptional MerR regulator
MSGRAKPEPAPTLGPRELAALTGISTDSLRHYEARGVLLPPHRTPAGYRRYPADAVARVALIQRALAVGFSLDELARVLKQRDKGGAPCREVYRLVTEKLGEVDRQVAEDGAGHDLRDLLKEWAARLDHTPPGQRAHLLESLPQRPAAGPSRRRRGFNDR